jgi:hypothetical protein
MVIEQKLTKATLTCQTDKGDGLTLEILPHPAISGCSILNIRSSKRALINASIVVNSLELKKVAEMLCNPG